MLKRISEILKLELVLDFEQSYGNLQGQPSERNVETFETRESVPRNFGHEVESGPNKYTLSVSGRRLCKTINQRKSGHRIEDWRSHYDKDKWRNSNGRYPHLQTES
ncbi:hypothetical protein L3Y34_013838 [Caenorhabditis briggsae]|uniref:Uncharacterized protein n=1 Tax=Caenorhabditis briggsae TaxID=6238 RepID=A0AAE8ZXU5_CAEBR|nr:hypothetical protein L3Y34_013838 [Caenorhabditis briggsae]